jgi:phosphoglycerol transferase MdoB-like AlkP superfamily enzyme
MDYLKKCLIPFIYILLLSLAVQVVARNLLFFFNASYFQISFSQYLFYLLAGVRFDLSSMAYANMLFVLIFLIPLPPKNKKWYKKMLFWSWLVPNTIILLPNIADAFYFPFLFRRSTFDIFQVLGVMQNDLDTLWYRFIIDFWPAFILPIVFVFIYVFMYRKFSKNLLFPNLNTKSIIKQTALLLLTISLSVVAMRGGLQEKPITLVSAGKYAVANHTPLVLNSSFSIIRTYGRAALDKKNFFENEIEMLQHFSKCKTPNTNDVMQEKNVVLIILESFSNEHFNSLNEPEIIEAGKNFTPFLDSLIHEGIFFTNAFANGKRSIEGITAIISSMPTLMHSPYILSPYANNNLNSLPQILKNKGYSSSFFHGGKNGTMNFDSYAKIARFDNYIGMNEYPDASDFDGKWGIWDEPFLLFTVNELSKYDEPFFAAIFTLSSHHPYQVPEKLEDVLPSGPLPIHKSIAYTDLALRQFFQKASRSAWYNNTLFVITSDHSSEPYLQKYKEPAGMFSIPLLFFEPNSLNKKMMDKTCQQTDIMPSILDYLKYPYPYAAFGNSVFDSTYSGMSISFMSDTYQLIADSMLVVVVDDMPVRFWNFKNDLPGHKDLLDNVSYEPMLKKYLLLYKSFVQQYNNSLIMNDVNCD